MMIVRSFVRLFVCLFVAHQCIVFCEEDTIKMWIERNLFLTIEKEKHIVLSTIEMHVSLKQIK